MRAGPPLILGYHGIGEVAAPRDPVGLYVTPEALSAQVRRLLRRGYELVTMSEFATRLRELGEPPRGIAALTFDDGTSDHAEVLPHLLAGLGVPGTVFVCPGLAGADYPWTTPEAGIRFMTLAQLTELAAHPHIEIGAHTNEHRELHEADTETALAEMLLCKRTLEDLLGTEVQSFCYPRCHYSEAARLAAPEAGYSSAVTCGLRGSWAPYELRREVIQAGEGPAVVELRLRGAYSGAGAGTAGRGWRLAARGVDRVVVALGAGPRPERS